MKKFYIDNCEAYFKMKKNLKENIKAYVLDFEYDEDIYESMIKREISNLSGNLPIELWTVQMIDYVYKKKRLGQMWKKIREKYLIDTFDEIELYKEERTYLLQLGKAKLNRDNMKEIVSYLRDSLYSSFLLVGECQDNDRLMDMLYELEKNPNEIIDIVNFVCHGNNKVIYLIHGVDGDSLVIFLDENTSTNAGLESRNIGSESASSEGRAIR